MTRKRIAWAALAVLLLGLLSPILTHGAVCFTLNMREGGQECIRIPEGVVAFTTEELNEAAEPLLP